MVGFYRIYLRINSGFWSTYRNFPSSELSEKSIYTAMEFSGKDIQKVFQNDFCSNRSWRNRHPHAQGKIKSLGWEIGNLIVRELLCADVIISIQLRFFFSFFCSYGLWFLNFPWCNEALKRMPFLLNDSLLILDDISCRKGGSTYVLNSNLFSRFSRLNLQTYPVLTFGYLVLWSSRKV